MHRNPDILARSRLWPLRLGKVPGVLVSLVILAACATTEDEGRPNLLSSEARAQAKVDETRAYIEAANLETVDAVRVTSTVRLQTSNRRFAVVEINSSSYILETERDCAGLETRSVQLGMVDFRMQRRVLRAGYDTIRGCRIKAIYKLPKAKK